MATDTLHRPVRGGALPAADRTRLAEARRLQQEGRMHEAESLFRDVLRRHPGSFDAMCGLGLFACALGRLSDGATLLRGAIAVDPTRADAYVNLARALYRDNQVEAALASMSMALQVDETDDEARWEAAAWLVARDRRDEAGRVIAAAPQAAEDDAGRVAWRAGRSALALGDAEIAIDRFAVAVEAGVLDACLRQGELLARAGRHAEADAAFERALVLDPRHGAALCGRAAALMALQRGPEAHAAARRAIEVQPRSATAWNLLGASLRQLNRPEEACESFREALRMDMGHRQAISNFANTLLALHQYEEAALAYERLLAVWPDCEFAKGQLLHSKMLVCDWLQHERLAEIIAQEIDQGRNSAEPFGLQAWCDSPARLQRAARTYSTLLNPPRGEQTVRPVPGQRRIRVGYVSGEFRLQATSILLVNLLELHDRTAFEIVAFDNDGGDGSEHRRRVEQAVDEIVPIAGLSDDDAAARVRERGIDILVDLNGFYGRARSGLFARRPAPVQVNYLGFPGTLGAPYMDYIVADAVVIPEAEHAFYDEAVVTLPHCYQPHDARRRADARPITRAEHGLPAQGFVFCCFNNPYKITPQVFAVWMRLLAQVPGSVLWLFEINEASSANLRTHAREHGVATERLVFARHLHIEQHLARLALADLVLDTLPYNAHTTGSDALWAGVPVLTCVGNSFAGRVGASLLTSAGLHGLVTRSMAEYEATALRLATAPSELASWRERLAAQRTTAPLFDIDLYRRHLEQAFAEMHRRACLGLPPAAIDVAVRP